MSAAASKVAAAQSAARAAIAGLPATVLRLVSDPRAFLRMLYLMAPALILACLAQCSCPFKVPGELGVPEVITLIIARNFGFTGAALETFVRDFSRSVGARKLMTAIFAHARRVGHVKARETSQVEFGVPFVRVPLIKDGILLEKIMYVKGTYHKLTKDATGSCLGSSSEAFVLARQQKIRGKFKAGEGEVPITDAGDVALIEAT